MTWLPEVENALAHRARSQARSAGRRKAAACGERARRQRTTRPSATAGALSTCRARRVPRVGLLPYTHTGIRSRIRDALGAERRSLRAVRCGRPLHAWGCSMSDAGAQVIRAKPFSDLAHQATERLHRRRAECQCIARHRT